MAQMVRRRSGAGLFTAFNSVIEAMESRVFLSASAAADAYYPDLKRVHPTGSSQPDGYANASLVGGLSVAMVRGAYGLGAVGSSTVTFGGVQGDGTGQTIAVVDAYNDPDIVTDLQTFDAGEGLPNPTITVVGQTGSTTSLPPNGATSGSNDWSGEESLDVEWAHAIAPGASILVVECTSNSGNYLEQGDAIASAYTGVSVVSNSYGGGESSGETSLDPYFTTPTNHSGVSFSFRPGTLERKFPTLPSHLTWSLWAAHN